MPAEVADLKAKLAVFTEPGDDAPDADAQTVSAAQREAIQKSAGSLAGAYTDEEAKEFFGPHDPEGLVNSEAVFTSDHLFSGSWYIVRRTFVGRVFFNTEGSFWTSDIRKATPFPSYRESSDYIRSQEKPNAATDEAPR